MENDFDSWNEVKKSLSEKKEKYYFKSGDIWWISVGKNIGTESYGKGGIFRRPVLIIKKLSNDSCVALPLTSKNKTGSWFARVSFHGECRTVLLSQIRMVHCARFQRRLAVLDEADFGRVKEKLKQLLELF